MAWFTDDPEEAQVPPKGQLHTQPLPGGVPEGRSQRNSSQRAEIQAGHLDVHFAWTEKPPDC